MGVIGNLDQYTKFQTATAMEEAAKNPGGMAGGGMGMGMGFAMANQMGQSMTSPPQQQPPAATPPPLPQTPQFHVAIDGTQSGPFDLSALKQHVQSGKLTRETLVWRQGMANWTAAGQVEELTNLFGAVPPPLPPQ
jgi:hypothetical protein